MTNDQIRRIRQLDNSVFRDPDFPVDWLEQLCDLALDRESLLTQAIRLCEQQLVQDEARGRLQARSILTRLAASLRALLRTATLGE